MKIRKKFDPKLHETFDNPAREAVLEFLGPLWSNNGDIYGPDLVGPEGEFVEVEVKNNWKSTASVPDFPFASIQLPERKGKWKGLPIEFWILRKDKRWAAIIPAASLKSKYLTEVPNRLVESGEYFFQIPIREVLFQEIREVTTEEENNLKFLGINPKRDGLENN